ncbi:LysE family translocator [Paenibacillus nanensis]|uniref:LysE family translocator n=2 Tax=Paenibacillus nanensis TaxID=393251 RepID=A0A3A1UUH3_9BACL|nr:LysE family translocator [Paenibacillus nanensis]
MSLFLAMCLFSLSMSISPGPVNMTILTSGVNFGFKRTFSFVSGATLGFVLLLTAVGLGVSNLAAQVPSFYGLLKYAGSGYMIYVGCKIMTARPDLKQSERQTLRYRHGFLMQWLNPKAWIACLTGVSAFGLKDSYSMLFVFVCIYFLICYLSLAAWALLGAKLQLLTRVRNGIRAFNAAMGAILILVAVYLLFSTTL